jgi:hypothetical protein
MQFEWPAVDARQPEGRRPKGCRASTKGHSNCITPDDNSVITIILTFHYSVDSAIVTLGI